MNTHPQVLWPESSRSSPSLTETVALTVPRALIGATAWCDHPRELELPRVGGPKDPDLAAIPRPRTGPGLMNVDENRRADARP
jgi:hypothetical protein